MSNLPLTSFERYRPIIDNWLAFEASCRQPLPTTIWANTLRVTPEILADELRRDGITIEPINWQWGAFRLPAGTRLGQLWQYHAGLFQIQEEAALVAVRLLDPQPGERILDLCAAPGNKSAQISVALANTGTVIANDIKIGRIRAIRNTVTRLGLVNIYNTVHDGATYPDIPGQFDRVLVDVPCTAEGTIRKKHSLYTPRGIQSDSLANRQLALLRRAAQLCRINGRIVYATCTFAPEENEGVIAALLTSYPGKLKVRMAKIDGLQNAPGLTAWADARWPKELANTMRIWPHHNDTGGFFAAVIEKLEPLTATEQPFSTSNVNNTQICVDQFVSNFHAIVKDRFGIPDTALAYFKVLEPNKRGYYIVSADYWPMGQPKPDFMGLFAMHDNPNHHKLTTGAAMMLSRWATRNVVDINRAQLDAYRSRQDMPLTRQQLAACTSQGYILVRHRGIGLGIAILLPNTDGAGRLRSQYPKEWSTI